MNPARDRALELARDPPRFLREWLLPELSAHLASEEGRDVAGLDAGIEIVLRGGAERPPKERAWHFELERGSVQLRDGLHPTPSIILELDAADFADLVTGILDPERAMIDGRLELAGDLGLASMLVPALRAVLEHARALPPAGR